MIETTNKTKLFGIIGTPILHTLSPKMHSYMAKKSGQDLAYLAFDVTPLNFDDVILGVKKMGASGFNITAPHKISVMKHLDKVSDDARIMDSVNTIVNENGVWHGYNTDGDGFCESLLLEGCEIKNKNVLMMGAGGSARSLCYKLGKFGAKSITITSRSMDKIHIIGDMVEKYTDASFSDEFSKNKDYDILINTTPVGMHPDGNKNPCNFMDIVNDNMTCADIIYNPKKTLFLKESEKRGAKIINGLSMLVLQGVLAFEKFTNTELPKEETYNELMNLFYEYKI